MSGLRAGCRTPAWCAVTMVVMIVLIGSSPYAVAEVAGEPELAAFAAELEENMPQLLDNRGVPGAAVAVIEGGRVIMVEGFGVADRDSQRPVTADTVFQVASISKTVTAWTVLHLVEEGLLALDDPAEAYLSRWQIPESGYDSAGVTIRRLLDHTAGLSVSGYPGYPPGESLPSLEESLEGASGAAVELIFDPGSRQSYSGGGYTVLQLVVEEVTGRSFAEYVREAVFQPLGMHQSTFDPDRASVDELAAGHGYYGNTLTDYRFTEQAAAGLMASAADLAEFCSAFMVDAAADEPAGRGLLSPEAVALMQQTPDDAEEASFGLGVLVQSLASGHTIVSHSGGNRGWRSYWGYVPGRDHAIVILTNSDRGHLIISDVVSRWLKWSTGDTIQTGGPMDGAIRVLLILGLLFSGIYAARIVRLVRSGQLLKPVPGHWPRIKAIALVVFALSWLIVWYTDLVLRLVQGTPDFIPVVFMPRTFHLLTALMVLVCVTAAAHRPLLRRILTD